MEGWRQFKLGQEDRFWLRTEDNLLFFSCPARLNKAGCGRRQGSPLCSDRCRGAPKTRGLDRGPRRPEPCNYPGKRKTKGYERPKPLDIDRPSHGSSRNANYPITSDRWEQARILRLAASWAESAV